MGAEPFAHESGERRRLLVVTPHETFREDEPLPSATLNARPTSNARLKNGFSQSTCFLAASARSVHFTCIEFGREMYTASTAGSSSSAS
jgi:hypothetical protein